MKNSPKHTPPAWIRKLLEAFLDARTLEVSLGDLEEKFQQNLNRMSLRKARLLYALEGLGFMKMAGQRKRRPSNQNTFGMYKNYFKIGWRNLAKDKGYALLNIGGLAIGVAAAMLIGLWIYEEASFNADNRNYHSVAIVNKNRTYNGNIYTETSQALPLAHALRTVYGNYFENVATGSHPFEHSIKYGETTILKRGLYMEEGGQQILDLKIISGALNQTRDPFSILISESVAASLFKDESPLNKVVRIDDKVDVKIAGVYRDFPHGSTFREIGMYGSMTLFETTDAWVKNSKDRWDVNSFPVYVRIAPNTTFEDISSKIKNVVFNQTKDDTKPELFLYPMSKWHLYQDFKDGKNIGTGMRYLWSFGCVGIFVLMLACINFMNLSTARYEKRAKEIGIRKAMGSARSQLIAQFYVETFLYVLSAIFLSVILVHLALPWLNEIANKKITALLFNPLFWLAAGAFGIVTGILAGSYPAFFLSSFNAVNVLKGKLLTRYSSTPRKILVVIQFCISLTLIIAAGVIYEQVQFVKNRPIGYEKDGLIYIQRRSPSLNAHYEAFKKDLLDSRHVVGISQSSNPVTESWFSSSDFAWQGKDPDFKEDFVTLAVSAEFGNTVSWELLHGRNFSGQLSTDSSAMIVNESAMKIIGKQNLLDETITWEGKNYRVVGVIKDLLLDSPYEHIKPTVFVMRKMNLNFINLRLNPDLSIAEAVAGVEKVFKKYSAGELFDFRFASALHNLKFRKEEQVAKLSVALSGLAIVISCMGMFGLASFMAEQRTKEIGVRKVLGATLFNLCRLLAADFVMLVMISFAMAVPFAYYAMSNWLTHYEYHTQISVWIFLATGIGAFVITLATVCFQAVKAALVNPVRSLKAE
ncbi:ABC transporter permease [Chryseolinea lacunae]|uniref:ABC transporter permease n=1 Tax=Chryseolinea lacunae TaxID=2801331 RepID=A0ABS1KP27_9BACT|nr:ABC transporter permease [Chryseolinea lacunae]MBL0741017.1 ABC transporter permease [Chryseolinea lacunae]